MMKLSEKLAALEAQERVAAKKEESNGNGTERRRGERRTGGRNGSTWSDAKRKVRELVLADLSPKLTGPKALKGSALEKEVKATLDRILRREEVKISPIERQKFVSEVISDTLG